MLSINVQSQNEETWEPKKLLKDLDQLEFLITAHPDPYQHISKKEVDNKFNEVKASFIKPKSTLAFYKDVASIIALIKDGHSSAYLPKNWFEYQRKKHGAFPYEMYLINDDELFVIKDFNNGKIPIGAKITKINGIRTTDFLTKFNPYISYERKAFRNTFIDNDFEKFLYIAFGHSKNTKLTFVKSTNEEVMIPNMPFKEWKKII